MVKNVEFSGDAMHFLKRPVCLKDQIWPDDVTPLVSISCTVYNQKRYVERCISSFLNQETTFPVEIIIHDDASTDGTTEILKKYQSTYPKLIQLICQIENQFSKGKMVNEENFLKARGSYIALCHGDDYWIDCGKIEKQVLVMQELGVSMCGHPAKKVDIEGNDLNFLTGFLVNKVKRFHPKKLINRNGNMLPFGSIMINRASLIDLLENMPPVMFHTGIQMLSARRGGLAIMPEPMSAYRINVPGSTTEIMLGNREKRLETAYKRVKSIKHLKFLYGKGFYQSFDNLLARQVSSAFLDMLDYQSLSLLLLVLRGEPVETKVRILFIGFYFFFKAQISRLIKNIKKALGKFFAF